MKVLIIGGTGGMGQWFTRFLKERDYDVIVWGSSGKVEVAQQMEVQYAHDLDKSIADADIVMISVPIDITPDIIEQTAPKMKSGSLLMDLTSIKTKPVEAMKQYAPRNVEILGTHPMFGPSIPTLHGQIVIICPVEDRCEKWFSHIHDLFEQNGAHIEIIDPEEHDHFVSVVQGLTHFAYITIGSTFRSLDFDIDRSRRFMSPVYEIMVDFVGRILGQNPYLYAHIQMENPSVPAVHRAFIEQCQKLSAMVADHDTEGFCQEMTNAAAHFKNTPAALHRSDKLINARIEEVEEMIHSIGRERGFLHLHSGVTHIGMIKKVTPNTVILSTGITLKTENVRLLNAQELLEWKKGNLTHTIRDISVLIPQKADPKVLQQMIGTCSGIVSTEIIDIYQEHNITYRITILGDRPASTVQETVEQLLCGLGCTIRG